MRHHRTALKHGNPAFLWNHWNCIWRRTQNDPQSARLWRRSNGLVYQRLDISIFVSPNSIIELERTGAHGAALAELIGFRSGWTSFRSGIARQVCNWNGIRQLPSTGAGWAGKRSRSGETDKARTFRRREVRKRPGSGSRCA